MTKDKWYSPRLERKTVRRLYFKAKAQGIPMTVLANQFVEKALGKQRADGKHSCKIEASAPKIK